MLPLSVLILVLLLVRPSLITAMLHVGYLISMTHLCFILFLSLYILIYVGLLIYSTAQLQECLIN